MLRFTNEADLGSPSRTTVAAFVNGDEVYNDTLDGEILHIISSISIGDGFSGFIEGIGIDTRLSSESDNTPRTDAIFLPQCLCPADSTLTAGEEFCSTPQETNQRYAEQTYEIEHSMVATLFADKRGHAFTGWWGKSNKTSSFKSCSRGRTVIIPPCLFD